MCWGSAGNEDSIVSAVMTETRRNGVPAEVHAFLTLWGNYQRRDRSGPNGYPKQSPFVKSSLYGKLGIPQDTNVRVEAAMPAHVEMIQRIVEQMPIELSEVIVTKYQPVLNEAGNEPSPDAMAKSLHMSASTFRNRLEGAQWYVYARMYP
jgi:hypothetical protein